MAINSEQFERLSINMTTVAVFSVSVHFSSGNITIAAVLQSVADIMSFVNGKY